MKYTEGNIQFNNVKTGGVFIGVSGPLTTKSKYNVNENDEIQHRNSDYLVNAIDIHWNNAQLENINTEIVTTADLLKIIDNAYSTIATLSNTITELQEELNNTVTSLNNKYDELTDNLETFANSIS